MDYFLTEGLINTNVQKSYKFRSTDHYSVILDCYISGNIRKRLNHGFPMAALEKNLSKLDL